MKFSTFALASVAAMAASYAPTAEATLVLKAADGSEFHACADDAEVLGQELGSLLDQGRRALRSAQGDRKLPSCATLCAGFYPGTCYRAFPWCDGWRRSLQEDRNLLTQVYTVECDQLKLDAHEKIIDLAKTELISADCGEALLAVKEWGCFSV